VTLDKLLAVPRTHVISNCLEGCYAPGVRVLHDTPLTSYTAGTSCKAIGFVVVGQDKLPIVGPEMLRVGLIVSPQLDLVSQER